MGGSTHNSALVFDFGERRIGVASANRSANTASALVTLQARGGVPDWRTLDGVMREWQPGTLVVGLPLNADGTDSAAADGARSFAAALAQRYGLPVETLDEGFTSAEAVARLRERRRQGLMKRRVRPGDVDRVAAQLIAESWLRGGDRRSAPR